jgi:hypothetical protein
MDDYSALAQRTAVSVPEVRGCLILSRDGLVLGAYPDQDEAPAKAAWLRFCVLGEPDRSFIEFGDQTWAFVKRGPYAAFALADPGVRPGILIDQLEQALLVAEEGRTKRETLRVPDAASAPSGKPRTSLHPPTDRPSPADVGADRRQWSSITPEAVASGPTLPSANIAPEAVSPVEGPPPTTAGEGSEHRPEPPIREFQEDQETTADAAASALQREPQRLAGAGEASTEDDSEVDRVLLAKEFSGLLQMDLGDDEGSS